MKGAGSILVFVAAFVVVTIIIIFLNSKFNNIFKFDFSAPHALVINKKDSTGVKNQELSKKSEEEKKASELNIPGVSTEEVTKGQNNKDSVANVPAKTNNTVEPVKNTQKEKQVAEKKVEKKNTTAPVKTPPVVNNVQKNTNSSKPIRNDNIVKNTPAKVDSSYIKWTKNTAAIYETMDSKKAAKIIQNYSDNIARDIIYAMKKKKAAEILAELSPDVANKITKAK